MTQGTRGSRSGRRTAHAVIGLAPLALVALCVVLWTCALVSSAAAGSSPTIQITQCTGDPTTDPKSCQDRPTTVHQSQPAPRPASRPASQPSPPTETHNYSLSTGKGNVQSTNGTKKAEPSR